MPRPHWDSVTAKSRTFSIDLTPITLIIKRHRLNFPRQIFWLKKRLSNFENKNKKRKTLCFIIFSLHFFESTAKNGLESIFLGLVNDQCALTGLSLADSLQNRLFASPNFTQGSQIDLAATNINRGRDHGLPSYTKVRQACGFPSVTTFAQLNDTIPAQNIAKLQSMYANVNDIDLYVGGLAEAGIFINKTNAVGNNFRLNGSVVGSTFGCLLAKQFVKLKKGDRFFYENAPNLALGTNSTAFTIGIKHKNNINLKGYLLNFLFFKVNLALLKIWLFPD